MPSRLTGSTNKVKTRDEMRPRIVWTTPADQPRSSPGENIPPELHPVKIIRLDGLAVGSQLNFGSTSYREYKCSPSDQFDGLTWCQKTRSDKERRRSYTAAYSLLHSRDGNILYINRSQEPAFFNAKEAEVNIQRYSRKIGESPRIMKMPHRGAFQMDSSRFGARLCWSHWTKRASRSWQMEKVPEKDC
jgi:hypothetical protein